MDRRRFLCSAAMPLVVPSRVFPQPARRFPDNPAPRALFPCPADGASIGVNPPGFAWWRVPEVDSYRLAIRDRAGVRVYEASGLLDPVHLPTRVLSPGEYSWDVEAVDSGGRTMARRGLSRFQVAAGLPELPWQDPKKLLARVPGEHPRYIFPREGLDRIRDSLKTTRRLVWEEVRRRADQALQLPLPEPPRYHTFETPTLRRLGYFEYFRKFRAHVDQGMSVLALAYLLSGDERYGLAAKRILLELESWGLEGPMSVLSPFGDEPGLSLARHGHRVYDWLHPLMDEGERKKLRAMAIGRARQVLTRLRKADYLALPAESHNGRLIAYLAEHAIVVNEEASDSSEWLDYSLRALTTFYPHWAGTDGGWAEGISYATSYNTIYLPALEALRGATGFDLYQRPFFRRVRRFFLYCTSPVGEIRPFGDGAERGGVGSQGAALMMHFGRRFHDPASVWWARQTGESTIGSDPMVSLLTEDSVEPASPSEVPSAAVFRGVGWAGLHSSLDRPKADTFVLFKSSPFGSVSHSHADQNSFSILKGGRALAIPSGYYGPAYGRPHHADWTRQTKANNSILVNGQGQVVRESTAQGAIAKFQHQKALTYLCGDAARAYGGRLEVFLRHLLFLRPGVILLVDELETAQPSQFQWLLHSFEEMSIDSIESSVTIHRRGATLQARLACEAGLEFAQTDRFDPPFNEGSPEQYRRQVANHWHFAATTRNRVLNAAIGAILVVRDEEESFSLSWKEHPGWLGVALETEEGHGEAWLRVSPGSAAPTSVTQASSMLSARWEPREGAVEEISISPGRAG